MHERIVQSQSKGISFLLSLSAILSALEATKEAMKWILCYIENLYSTPPKRTIIAQGNDLFSVIESLRGFNWFFSLACKFLYAQQDSYCTMGNDFSMLLVL